MRYWLIYSYKDELLPVHRANGFNDIEELKDWFEELKERVNLIDVAKSMEDDKE